MEYSKYQKDIFSAYNNTRKNIVVDAAPGSGKTFTIVEMLKMTPQYKKVLMMAFNKSIQEELKEKVPEFVDVFTFHAMGFKVLRRNFKENFTVDENKYFKIFYPFLRKRFGEKEANKIVPILLEYSNFYRMGFCQNDNDIKELLKERGIFFENSDIDLLNLCHEKVSEYDNSDKDKFKIDFIDMIELPVKWIEKYKFPKYNVVFLDEIQDANKLQKEFIERLISDKGRFIAVGDERQSIYGFMGSDKNSFRELAQKKNTIKLPLSVSYRCPKEVIKKASDYFGGVEAYHENIDGIVRNGNLSEVSGGDFVICRNNLPLFQSFLKLIVLGKKAQIIGKDIETNILKITNDFIKNGGYVNRYKEILDKKKEELKERDVRKPHKNKSFIVLKDLLDTVVLLINHFGSEKELKKNIETIFSDKNGKGIKLMTGHKSKGLEADRVFWLLPELIPSEFVRTKAELDQEKSLAFVIITRAKKELIMISEI